MTRPHGMPHRAVILAAGRGVRIDPLSRTTPKPLMPFWGKPLIFHILQVLKKWGVTEVLINLHHAPDSLLNYLRNLPNPGLRINLSFEPELLGTGGALRKCEWFIGSEPFWMINSDIIPALDPAPIVKLFYSRNTFASLWLTDAGGPRTVAMKNGVVTDFRSPDRGSPGTFTFCGLQLVSPAICGQLFKQPFFPVIEVYERAIKKGLIVSGCTAPGSFWADLGTPETYIEAHKQILNRRKRGAIYNFVDSAIRKHNRLLRKKGIGIEGIAVVSPNAVVERGATLKDAVIWDHAVITGKARIDSAIVGNGVRVTGHVTRMVLRADDMADQSVDRLLEKVRWNRHDTVVVPLPPRASSRCFFRIRWNNRQAIMMTYDTSRPENLFYFDNAMLLKKAGVPVPSILAHAPEDRIALLEDLGDISLADAITGKTDAEIFRLYCGAIDIMARLHSAGARLAKRTRIKLAEPFSAGLYRWERNLFADQFLSRYLRFDRATVNRMLADLAPLSRTLLRQPGVLIHRDLQSSNILVYRWKLYLIDFQGMRFGPALYDVASLLCDPYVSLAQPMQKRLLDYYVRRTNQSPVLVGQLFPVVAIQRLIQALGAYGRMAASPDTERFARFIPPALRQLERVLAVTDGLPHLRRMLPMLNPETMAEPEEKE